MKKINIAYWIVTILLALLISFGAIFDIMMVPEAIESMKHLGYPVYLLPFIGWAKLLGSITILVPRFPRLKEWAYAGITIDVTGALYSHISVGDPASVWGFIFVAYALIAASYMLHHKRLKAKRAATI
jgi:uncharacterized membrane protein YphA (DoxX/SURF4 family)